MEECFINKKACKTVYVTLYPCIKYDHVKQRSYIQKSKQSVRVVGLWGFSSFFLHFPKFLNLLFLS